jgi:hypothetical protein
VAVSLWGRVVGRKRRCGWLWSGVEWRYECLRWEKAVACGSIKVIIYPVVGYLSRVDPRDGNCVKLKTIIDNKDSNNKLPYQTK